MPPERRKFLLWRVSAMIVATPIEQVHEIIVNPSITPVPRSASFVSGISNVHGDILTVIHAAKRLGLPDEIPTCMMISDVRNFRVGILVDNVIETGLYECEPVRTSPLPPVNSKFIHQPLTLHRIEEALMSLSLPGTTLSTPSETTSCLWNAWELQIDQFVSDRMAHEVGH